MPALQSGDDGNHPLLIVKEQGKNDLGKAADGPRLTADRSGGAVSRSPRHQVVPVPPAPSHPRRACLRPHSRRSAILPPAGNPPRPAILPRAATPRPALPSTCPRDPEGGVPGQAPARTALVGPPERRERDLLRHLAATDVRGRCRRARAPRRLSSVVDSSRPPPTPRRRTRSRGPERGAALSGRRRFVGRAGRVNGRTPASTRAGCYLLLATAAPARYRTTAVQNLARAPALPPRPTKSSGASAGFSAAAIPVADDPIWTRKPTGAKGRPAAICARLDALDV